MPLPSDTRSDRFAAASELVLRHARSFVRRKQLFGVDPEMVVSDVLIGLLRTKIDPDPTSSCGRAYLMAATENAVLSHKRSERCAKRGGKIRVVRLSEPRAAAFVGKSERARRGQSTRPESDAVGLQLDLEQLVLLAKPGLRKAILRAYSVGVDEAAREFGVPRRTLGDAIVRLAEAGDRMGMRNYLVASPLFAPIASSFSGGTSLAGDDDAHA